MHEICRLNVCGSERTGAREVAVFRLSSPNSQAVLDSIVGGGAEALLLADCRGVEDLQRCDVALSVAEARAGGPAGHVRIIASVDTAAGVMRMSGLGGKSVRLTGLAWNRQAFAADMACPVDSAVADHAQAQVLIAARAFGLEAYIFDGDRG